MRNLIASIALAAAMATQGQIITNGNFESMGVASFDGWTIAQGDTAWPEAWAAPEGQAWSMHAQKGGASPQSGLIYQPLSSLQEGDTADFNGWIMPTSMQNSLCGMGIGLLQSGWVTMSPWADQPLASSVVFMLPLGDWSQLSGTFVVPALAPGDTLVAWLYVGETGTEALFDAISITERIQLMQPNYELSFWAPPSNPHPGPVEIETERMGEPGDGRMALAWPNPAADRSTIRMSDRPTFAVAYSASGQATRIPVDWNGSAVVGLEALSPGRYTIMLQSATGSTVSRLTVER